MIVSRVVPCDFDQNEHNAALLSLRAVLLLLSSSPRYKVPKLTKERLTKHPNRHEEDLGDEGDEDSEEGEKHGSGSCSNRTSIRLLFHPTSAIFAERIPQCSAIMVGQDEVQPLSLKATETFHALETEICQEKLSTSDSVSYAVVRKYVHRLDLFWMILWMIFCISDLLKDRCEFRFFDLLKSV